MLLITMCLHYACKEEAAKVTEAFPAAGSDSTTKNTFTSLFPFRSFQNMEKCFHAASEERKNILLYFTGDFCIYARIMESTILNNPALQGTLDNNFCCYILAVDERSPSDKSHSDLQLQRFHSNTLPLFALLDNKGRTLALQSYTIDTDTFGHFIKQGLSSR